MAGKVYVGCKLNNGFVLHHDKEASPGDPAGARFVRDESRGTVTLAGRYADPKTGILHPAGYGITAVDETFWNDWLVKNQESPLVKNGIIFAERNRQSAESKGTEMQHDVKTGLEGIDPEKPAPGLKPVKDE